MIISLNRFSVVISEGKLEVTTDSDVTVVVVGGLHLYGGDEPK